VAERLGRGLQSPVQRFESAPRLCLYGCERGSPREIENAFHSSLVIKPAQIDLSRFDLRVTHQPLERFQFARVRLKEPNGEGGAEGLGVNLDAGSLAELLDGSPDHPVIAVARASLLAHHRDDIGVGTILDHVSGNRGLKKRSELVGDRINDHLAALLSKSNRPSLEIQIAPPKG
jgi:hypothetical protein